MQNPHTFLISLLFAIFIQTSNMQAQDVKPERFMVDIYYGFPPDFESNIEVDFLNSTNTYIENSKNYGPLGVRLEYMVSPTIGLGIESNYGIEIVQYTDSLGTDIYDFSTKALYVMLRFNYHFGHMDKFDPYFGVCAGYKSFTFNSTPSSTSLRSPVAIRLAAGGRYFFTDHLGVHVEMGLGGGFLLSAGLSFRF